MIKLSPRSKRNISRILPFGIIWFLLANIFLFVEQVAIEDASGQSTTAINLDFQIFLFATIAVTIVGLLVGSIEVLFLSRRFRNESFSRKMLYKTLIYFTLLFTIILITFPIAASMELNTELSDPKVWERLWFYLGSKAHLSTDLQMLVSLVVSLFYSEISENVGHGVLLNFFTGKYHQPMQEKRIFMFLDMKSSTTIAEQLGHVRYFDLLRSYYQDLSNPIIDCEAEVYQYVGDEVVVSWKYDRGIADNNCLKCFFAMKKALQMQTEVYKRRFGLVPTFKAGIHCGEVTTGEVGTLKKEIVFTGDVLNATARIQSVCNQFEVDLLISRDLINLLGINGVTSYRSIGQIELKGKVETLELFTIDGMTDAAGNKINSYIG